MKQAQNYKVLYDNMLSQFAVLQSTVVKMKKEHEQEIGSLKIVIKQQAEQIRQQNDQIRQQNDQIRDLRRRDAFHDGPNTPPSKDTITQQQRRKKNIKSRQPSGRKPGGQSGHKGTTNKPKPDRIEPVKMKKCNSCGSRRIQETHVENKTITDTPPPPPPETIRYDISHYDCKKCGKIGMSADPGIPKKGAFGTNAVISVVTNFMYRMPNRKNAEYMGSLGVSMASGTIFAILIMVCGSLATPAQSIMASISQAKVLHIDETSISLAGRKIWIWIFYDPKTGRSLYLLRPSRGRDVIREVLGDCWKGIIICDGWGAYSLYRVQRCWAHLIRGLRDIADKNPDNADAYNALKRLRDIYHDAKMDVTSAERATLHKKVTRRMKLLIARYEDNPLLGDYMKKLERALPDAFRFVLDPNISSTNNPAETLLREMVIHRKIRGGIRSAKTMLWMGYLFTCITTWKNQGLDCRKQLLQYV